MRAQDHMNEKGMALPLILIFMAVFSVLGLGLLSMSIDEMKLISNFEDGMRAFYYAEGALNEAVAGYMQNGNAGRYEYSPAIAAGQVVGVAQIKHEQGVPIIRATGISGDVSKHVEAKLQTENGRLLLRHWKDHGLAYQAPKL